jgi:hypothetical protein
MELNYESRPTISFPILVTVSIDALIGAANTKMNGEDLYD